MTENPEEYEEVLRWRLELLKAKLEEGKVHFAPHLVDEFRNSLMAVRYGPDGKIDVSTVDGRVRAMALGMAGMHQREETKKAISLQDVASNYFDGVEVNFGQLVQEVHEAGLDAHEAAVAISSDPDAVSTLAGGIPEFLGLLEEFWSDVSDPTDYHIQDLPGLKAVFGGDLFPSHERNIASAIGLYAETIVLSDPFWHSRNVFERSDDQTKTYYLVKHAVNVLKYRDLALADVETPIVAFNPFRSSVDQDQREFLVEITETDGLKHAAAVFGRDFETKEDLWRFGAALDNPKKLAEAVVDPERLLFETNWSGTLEQQIVRGLETDWKRLGGGEHPGEMVVSLCFSRMGQASDILLKSRLLSGVPLIDAPTSWKYFNWKLDYNAAREKGDATNLHMLKGLQHVSETDEVWLGNIPSEALIEMRKEGAFAEIRDVLSSGVAEIARIKPEGYFRSSDRIVDNIRDAFEAHKKEVVDLRARSIKFAGVDIGSMVVAAGLDISSIITGAGTFGAASLAVNQLVDVPKIREIPEKLRDLKEAHKELRKSPMGLFFKHK